MISQYFTAPVIVGNSLPIWKLKNYLQKVAMTDSHVLITGETGTGKELAAHISTSTVHAVKIHWSQ